MNSIIMTVTPLMVPDRLKNLCSMSNQVIDLKQITAWSPTLHPAGHGTPPAISTTYGYQDEIQKECAASSAKLCQDSRKF